MDIYLKDPGPSCPPRTRNNKDLRSSITIIKDLIIYKKKIVNFFIRLYASTNIIYKQDYFITALNTKYWTKI